MEFANIMITNSLNLSQVHPSWQPCLKSALTKVDPNYLEKLQETNHWLPGHKNIFNAFTLPVSEVNYVLLGESPYPRALSANGYAFWDAAVHEIWTATGLSKAVNRATSLRNIIKMLLVAEGLLSENKTSQADIAVLDKTNLIKTNDELFTNLLLHGFLLLNASLVLHPTNVKKDALAWQPFTKAILEYLLSKNSNIKSVITLV